MIAKCWFTKSRFYKRYMYKSSLLILLLFLGVRAMTQEYISTDLFAAVNSKVSADKNVTRGTTLSLSMSELNRIFLARPAKLMLQIPFEGASMALELEQYQPLSNSFQVTVATSNAKSTWYPYEAGVFFRGHISNKQHSFVAVSFFNDEFSAVLADDRGNITIAAQKRPGSPGDEYIMQRAADADLPFTMKCDATEDAISIGQVLRGLQNASTAAVGCPVDIYVEADQAAYVSSGSNVTKTVNFVAAVMNAVSVIYLNENIILQLREVKVWTTSDPYAGNND